jgi:nitrate reductase NapD
MRVNRFVRAENESRRTPSQNILGILVHTHPNKRQGMAKSLGELEGAEIHQVSDDGRLIVTLEDTSQVLALDTYKQILEMPGVLNASLVYHHFGESQI